MNLNSLNEQIRSFAKKYKTDFTDEIETIGNKVYLKSDLHKYHDADTLACGLLLGECKKKFIPSFGFIDNYLQDAPFIRVDKKRAWLFLCGRDIFNDQAQILSRSPNVIVKDEDDNILGLATVHNNIIKNVLDRGIFLRREMR